MQRHVNVLGVGMTQFKTPRHADPYTVMGLDAGRKALLDAGVKYTDVEQAYVGFVYADSTAGQRVVYDLGMTGIPVFNVNNNCATGSTALYLARQAVESGIVECALALGFEQMVPGALGYIFDDRPPPLGKFTEVATTKYGDSEVPMAPFFSAAPAASTWRNIAQNPKPSARSRSKRANMPRTTPTQSFAIR